MYYLPFFFLEPLTHDDDDESPARSIIDIFEVFEFFLEMSPFFFSVTSRLLWSKEDTVFLLFQGSSSAVFIVVVFKIVSCLLTAELPDKMPVSKRTSSFPACRLSLMRWNVLMNDEVDFSLTKGKDPKLYSRKMGPVTGRQLHMIPTVISTNLVQGQLSAARGNQIKS